MLGCSQLLLGLEFSVARSSAKVHWLAPCAWPGHTSSRSRRRQEEQFPGELLTRHQVALNLQILDQTHQVSTRSRA